jgi:hypothetical protein
MVASIEKQEAIDQAFLHSLYMIGICLATVEIEKKQEIQKIVF